MKLPQDYDDQPKSNSFSLMTVICVCGFVFFILLLVLASNSSGEKASNHSSLSSSSTVSMNNFQDDITSEVIVPGELKPDDFDFWDMYPEEIKEEEPGEDIQEEIHESDPATDGKHTQIIDDDGNTEWVLISPYLPKHEFDFNQLACQGDRMKYYSDGRESSFLGIQISKHQEYVDFQKVKKDGIDFVMLRVGARGYGSGQIILDEYFEENIKRAKDAGLEIGVYFFSQAMNEEEVNEEADLVLKAIDGYDIAYPVVFDMEYVDNDTARIEKLTRDEITKLTKTFLKKIKSEGYNAMLYGDKEWLLKHVELAQLTEYDIWLSQDRDLPDYPYCFSMWEYSQSGNVDGVMGNVNLTISFIDYGEK